jgi:acetyl esterase/lipase
MNKRFVGAVALSLFFQVSAFAQMGGFGGPQGGGSVPDADKTADVNYVGDGKTYHTLDIYIPKQAKESYPVVIHTYGSAWSSNNMKGSADLSTICAAYVKAGYAVVTPNHRAASDAIYPAQLHDIKAVVRFVRGNAAKYKFDTNFVAVSGFSSGGHLSSLTATTCGLKEGKSGSVTVDLVGDLGEFTSFSSCVDGAVLWSPPTDIYTMNPISMGGSGTMEGAFIGVEREGNKDKWMVASSPYYASDDDPPVIMFHGTSDNIVNIEQSQELYDSLKNHNVVTEFVKVSGGSHGGNVMNSSENLSKAVAFLDKAREAKAAAATVTPPATGDSTTTSPATGDSTTTPPATGDSTTTPPATGDSTKTPPATGDSSVTASPATGDSTVTTPPATGDSTDALPAMRSVVSGPTTYKVFSLDGTLVMKSSTLNLSRLNPGVYYVVATRAGARQVFRIAKP